MTDRRMIMTALAAGILAGPAMAWSGQAPVRTRVFRAPDCGCCGAWVAHLRDHGFAVEVVTTDDMQGIKDRHAVPAPLRSCHTALIDRYVIKGHVPATDISALLAQRPPAAGLAVPGMPAGSPGMEMGGRRDPYDVILWTGSETRIFASHRG